MAGSSSEGKRVLGVTGLSIWGGVLGEEYLTSLKGTRKAKVFMEMQDDAVIGALLDSMWMPLLSAEFETTPAGETEKDKLNAEFLDQCMNDMTRYSWRQHVLDALSMMVWGWSAEEIVFKKRLGPAGDPPSQYTDGKIGLHILDPRGQETLYKWNMDEEFNVESMVQRDPNSGKLIEIESWKLLHATFRSRKRSPEGSSPLRSLYRAWYTRKNLEVIEAIGAERDLVGLPIFYLPYGATDVDKAAAETLIRNMRQDEEAGLVIPAPPNPEAQHGTTGWKFELIGSPGSKQFNVRQIVDDLNKIILMRFFAQFLLLGMQQVGTQALVEGSQDFFSLCLKSVQHELEEVWNQQLVPLLFSMNPGMLAGASGMPAIEWNDPGSKDTQKAVTAAQQMISAQLLTPDEKLEDYFRAMLGLPDRPEGLGVGPRNQPQAPGPLQGLMSYDWTEQADGSYIVKPKRVSKKFAQPGPEDVHIPTAIGKKSRDQCMNCSAAPTVEVLWAEGMGRAWFCDRCYKEWLAESEAHQVVEERKVENGTVPERWYDSASWEEWNLAHKKVKALSTGQIALAAPKMTSTELVAASDELKKRPYDQFGHWDAAKKAVRAAAQEKNVKVLSDESLSLELVGQDVIELSSYIEVAGIKGRRATTKVGRATNEYQGLLTAIYDRWSRKAQAAILGASDGERKGLVKEVDKQLLLLAAELKAAAAKHIDEAVRLGLKGPLDKQGMKLVDGQVKTNDKFVDESLIPRIREKIVGHLDALEAQHEYQLDGVALLGLLESMRAEPSSYAGAFWQSIFAGAGLSRVRDDEVRADAGEKPRRVRWVLDPAAEHCKKSEFHQGCPDMAGEYASWDDMATVPAGDVTCLGNCRCHVDVQNDAGGWDRVA